LRELPEAVIFDMDGTLCDVRGIRHLIDGPGGFHAFHRASASCPPNADVVRAAREQHAAGRAVLVVTARAARFRNVTAMWLALHGVPSDAMWMRTDGDHRPDYEVKRDILHWIRALYHPVAVWDDNPAVLRLWHQEGIPVTLVPGWDTTADGPPVGTSER
jgi:phosphoglycolate phosphatase-like HAD superfamily hydrolase